ncbi:hypothetical protein HMPREF0528_0004, partial [Lactobacillus johnsonii ATCC 33200]
QSFFKSGNVTSKWFLKLVMLVMVNSPVAKSITWKISCIDYDCIQMKSMGRTDADVDFKTSTIGGLLKQIRKANFYEVDEN